MKKTKLFLFVSVFFVSFSCQAFVLNLLNDIGVVCTTLTQMNMVNRKAALDYVKEKAGVDQEHYEFDDFENIAKRGGGIDGQSGAGDLAGDLPPEVHEIVAFLQNNEKYAEMGAKMPKGILFVGPPGTGKTNIARTIAHNANASFFHGSGSEFVEMYVGVGPQRVRELFEKARNSIRSGAYKTSIIFIDELDAIGGKRTDFDNSEYRNTLNELLNQMDGFVQDPGIVVLAATNKPDSLDSALKRPGRFDRIVEISLPNLENRKKIIEYYCYNVKINYFDDPLDFDVLAQKTAGLTPAEIKNLVNEAAILAVREKDNFVAMKHFEQVLKTIRKHRR